MSSPITLTGSLTREPELKFSSSGKAWVRFSVVTNGRVFNKETQRWEDKDATFWNCTAFGKMAENFVESVTKGSRVILLGTVKAEQYTDKEGNPKTEMRVIAEEIAVSVKFESTKPSTSSKPQNDGWGDEAPF